ncbi:MAG: hypothetical protein ABI217_01360 [Chthoniobacterales bacterium]
MAMKVKKFDAVEMSRQLREATSGKLAGMNREQELAYLQEAGERHRAEVKTRQKSCEGEFVRTVNRISVVASWNFQHLVNYEREVAFNPERFRGQWC